MLDDFRNHLWACFKHLGLGEPTPAQYAMAERLQSFAKDMQLQAGRGFGKSVITACLASWFLLRPGDHTTDNAFAFNVEARTKIGQDKSCFARGIGSQITGSHADFVIADDVEIEGNCETANAREKLLNKVAEFEQIRNVGGRVIFLGTPQIKDSIYTHLKMGYKVTKFPAVMPDKSSIAETEDVDEWVLGLNIEPNKPTQPERFPEEVLLERMAKIGPKLFALHYKLDTSLADFEKYPLRLSDLIVIDVNPDVCPEKIIWAKSQPMKGVPAFGLSGDLIYEPMWVSDTYTPYAQRVMYVDPSGRGEDETAICVASFANGYIYIHELIGYPGGYEKPILKKIAKMAYEYNVNMIRVESNFGDAMYCQLLAPIVTQVCGRIAIEDFRVSGRKEARIIDSLEPVMASHRLVFDRRAISQEANQKQITRIFDKRGALPKDDRIDVLAAAVSHWEGLLSKDVDVIIEKNQEAERNNIVKTWLSDDRRMGLWSNQVSRSTLNKGMPRDTPNVNRWRSSPRYW